MINQSQPTNLQLCPKWSKISEKCLQQLVESKKLKAKRGQPRTIKAHLTVHYVDKDVNVKESGFV